MGCGGSTAKASSPGKKNGKENLTREQYELLQQEEYRKTLGKEFVRRFSESSMKIEQRRRSSVGSNLGGGEGSRHNVSMGRSPIMSRSRSYGEGGAPLNQSMSRRSIASGGSRKNFSASVEWADESGDKSNENSRSRGIYEAQPQNDGTKQTSEGTPQTPVPDVEAGNA